MKKSKQRRRSFRKTSVVLRWLPAWVFLINRISMTCVNHRLWRFIMNLKRINSKWWRWNPISVQTCWTEITDTLRAAMEADIIVFLVAHKEFRSMTIASDKIVLDFAAQWVKWIEKSMIRFWICLPNTKNPDGLLKPFHIVCFSLAIGLLLIYLSPGVAGPIDGSKSLWRLYCDHHDRQYVADD